MKMLRFFGWPSAIIGAALLIVAVPVLAQNRQNRELGRQERGLRELTVLAGRGAEVGVRIADRTEGGVVVEEVEPDSPAEKAGIKRSDVITEFDGERVRSARQFERLVRETPPGRSVKATVTRDGQRRDVQITPGEGRGGAMVFDADRMRERLDGLAGRLPEFNFDFDFDVPGSMSGRRLGVTVEPLSPQLAEYFGAKDGVLVSGVTDGSAAARAGLKAGDVITSINGNRVTTREDLTRGLRETTTDAVTIGIVRDKKESSLKATIEPLRRPARGRPA
jgi:S1-C subfamily serine protease